MAYYDVLIDMYKILNELKCYEKIIYNTYVSIWDVKNSIGKYHLSIPFYESPGFDEIFEIVDGQSNGITTTKIK